MIPFKTKPMNLLLFTILMVMNTDFSLAADRNSANRVNALIVVDVQNCFITGHLALSKGPARQDGAKVIPVINDLIHKIPFDYIVYTHDWHPKNHISFYESLRDRRKYLKGDKYRVINVYDKVTYTGPKFTAEQILWPSHCIQGTKDAALHKDLYVSNSSNVIHINKGIDPDIESYSAFWDNNKAYETELDKKLKERNVTHVFVAGLALDYCVGGTAEDASDLKYKTYVIEDATAFIEFDTAKSKREHLSGKGVKIIQANEVKALVSSAICTYWSVILIISINLFILLSK